MDVIKFGFGLLINTLIAAPFVMLFLWLCKYAPFWVAALFALAMIVGLFKLYVWAGTANVEVDDDNGEPDPVPTMTWEEVDQISHAFDKRIKEVYMPRIFP